jgi:hypothetical protein
MGGEWGIYGARSRSVGEDRTALMIVTIPVQAALSITHSNTVARRGGDE